MSTNPPKSSKRWLLLLPAGCLGMMLVCCGAGGAIYASIAAAMRSSEPYQHALTVARQNDEVVTALGEPIEEGWFVTGSIQTSGSGGSADLRIPISGPKGDGHLRVVATRYADAWEYSRMDVEVGDRRFDLLGVLEPTLDEEGIDL